MMKIKKNLILKEATEIKSFIEKNTKLPLSCTLDNTQLSVYSTAYLMGIALKDKFKSDAYNLSPVIIYNNSRLTDTAIEKVMKEDYLKMTGNFVNYCLEHKMVPTYITTQKSRTKVSFELFTYCLAKILTYYQNNKTLPNYCLFDKSDLILKQPTTANSKTTNPSSTSTSKKTTNNTIFTSNPHPTKAGCGGMGQDTSYYCGVSALQKVLFKFGIKDYSQSTLAKWAGTTTAGTSHQGIKTAVAMVNKKKGTKITVVEKTFSEVGGWKGIGKILSNKNQDIIFHNYYRLKYGHYEVANQINTANNVVKVLNSLGDKCTSSCYCGYVESRSTSEFKKYMDAISQKSLIILTKN